MYSSALKTDDLPHIPELKDKIQRYTLDYGGSLIKLMYRDKRESKSETAPLKLAVFQSGDLEGLTSFIKQNVEDHDGSSEIFTTGVGIKKNDEALSRLLNTSFTNLNEVDCFVKALKLVLPSLPKDQLFYPLPKKQFIQAHSNALGFVKMEMELKKLKMMETSFSPFGDEGQSESFPVHQDPDQLCQSYGGRDILPAVIVMCSSGFAVFKYIDHTSGAQTLDYSPRGGRAVMGLGSLLTGVKTFEELMELASQGSGASIDTYVRDLKGGDKDDFYGMFPDDCYCFSFGKACGKDRDDFSRADLAASVVMYVCSDLAQLALNHAVSNKVKNVILCGTLISHKVIQEAVTLCFLGQSLGLPLAIQPTLRMCTMGPYLGAIGAWVAGMEKTQKPSTT